MIRKRKLLAPVALAAVGITVLAVSAATASTKSTINISIPGATRSAAPLVVSVAKPPAGTTFGIVTPLHADPGQAAMDTANARIASLVGAKSVMEDSALDASKQLQIADSMLSRGFKPIATDIIFPHSMDAFLKSAAAKNVPACLEFSTAPGGAQEDDALAGKEIAAYLHKLFPNGAKGAILANTPAAVILNREAGFAAAMKAYPDLKIVAKQRNLKEVSAEARTMAEGMLQAHPEIQFFWTTNDQEALGAGLAAAGLGKKLVIIGMNGTPEAVDAVKKGIITATWDSNQNMMGSLVAINCFNWLATGKAPVAAKSAFTMIDKSNAASWIPWAQRASLTVVK